MIHFRVKHLARGLAQSGFARSLAGAACVIAVCAITGCSSHGAPPSLAESLSVEQPGGTATQLLSSGTQLPTSATESFTTVSDNQKKIYVHVLRGAGKKAGKLPSDGWYAIDGVMDGPAGGPQVFVTFELDANAQLTLSARQEQFKLKPVKVEKTDGLHPAPLTEPDDDDEAEEAEGD